MTNTIRTTQQICEDIKDNSMGLDSILRKNRTRNLGSFLKKQKSEVEQQVKVEVVMVMIDLRIRVMLMIVLVIMMIMETMMT